MAAPPAQGRSARLIEGPVAGHLLRLTGPMVMGVMATMLFNLMDTFYVARLGGDPLAAMGYTFPIAALVHSLSLGLMVGASTVLARLIGAGQLEQVRRITTDALLLSALLIVALGAAGLLTLRPLFTALGADARLLPLIADYMVPYYLGAWLLVVPIVGNGAIRATGDTRMPSLIMMIAAIVNMVLDPFLIYGLGPFPRWELRGAAVASICAWSITFVAALTILGRRERMLARPDLRLRSLWTSWTAVLRMAVPVGFTNLVLPLSAGVITRMLSAFGAFAVAGYAVGVRVEMISLIGPMAMTAALSPFVGQNAGASRPERVQEALRTAVRWCWIWGGVACVVLFLLADRIAGLFSAESDVVRAAGLYLSVLPFCYGAMTSCFQVTTTLNALHRPFTSTLIALVRMFVLAIPLAWFGAQYAGVFGLFAGLAAGNLLAGVLAYVWVWRFLGGGRESGGVGGSGRCSVCR